MDFALSAEQELLKKELRHFLETECPKSTVKKLEATESRVLARDVEEDGRTWLAGVDTPGGIRWGGGNLLDLAVLLEEVGRATAPSPIFSTMVMGVSARFSKPGLMSRRSTC